MYYLGIRFLLSGLFMGLIFIRILRHVTKTDLLCGGLSGVMLALSFAAQTIGLQYTTPGKAGFLANACVIIVPFLVWALYRKRPTMRTMAGAMIAFIGLAVISLTERFTLQFGDFLEIMCAVFFAVQTLIVDRFADRVHPVRMAVLQVLVAGVLCMGVAAVTEAAPAGDMFTTSVLIALAYGVIFCTALSFAIQAWAQRVTQPSHVSLILCFEAVFSFLFALLFGYESLTMRSVTGSLLVIAGFLITEAGTAGEAKLQEETAGAP